MVTRKVPQESNKPDDAEDDEESGRYVHHPEFIIIDDDKKGHSGGKESAGYYEFISQLKQMHYPALFRAFTLGLSWMVFLASFLVLLCLLGSTGLALLGGFMNEEFNKPMKLFWGVYSRMLVFALGLFIAAFNPPFGFSLILLFFMLHGDSFENGFVMRIFKSQITRN